MKKAHFLTMLSSTMPDSNDCILQRWREAGRQSTVDFKGELNIMPDPNGSCTVGRFCSSRVC